MLIISKSIAGIQFLSNGGHFEFLNFFHNNCKTQKCFYLENRARKNNFDKIFEPQGFLQSGHPNFQKNFLLPKMLAILNLEFFAKNGKHKTAYVSKTVLDRAISTKFCPTG